MAKCRCCGSFSKSFRHAAATQHPNEICSCTANCNSFSKCMMIMMVYDWLTAADQENQKKQHGQLSNSIQIILEFLIIDHMIISTLRTVYWCLITKCELNIVWRPSTLQHTTSLGHPHYLVAGVHLLRCQDLRAVQFEPQWSMVLPVSGHDCRGEKKTDFSHGDTQDLRGSLNFKRVLTDHAIVYFRFFSFMAQQMRVSNIGEMRNTMEHCK